MDGRTGVAKLGKAKEVTTTNDGRSFVLHGLGMGRLVGWAYGDLESTLRSPFSYCHHHMYIIHFQRPTSVYE